MEIRLEKIQNRDSKLRELIRCYVTEMAQYLNGEGSADRTVNPIDVLDRYWEQQPNWPYIINAGREVAGFCLLRRYPGEDDTIDIDQYYVIDKFRRRGVGGSALAAALKAHPGNWLIRVLKSNKSAFRFWVDAVEGRVGKAYEITEENETMHFIRFRTQQ